MEKLFNFAYVTTNLVNGKQYVGDHSTNNMNDRYLGSGIAIKNAINEYGRCNFSREILANFETHKEAFESQEIYIKEYNTLTPNGYNISPKGGLCVKECHSLETREKISNSSNSWNKGLTKETDERIKQASIKWHKNNDGMNQIPSFTNHRHSEESKEQMRSSHLGLTHSEESKNKMRAPKSNEFKQKISKSNSLRIIKSVTCIYCGITCSKMNHTRWHGENCKITL